jgi:hypothetical protein
MPKATKALVTELYPLVEKSLSKGLNSYKGCIGRFIEKRHTQLYDTAPYDRIYYGTEDVEDFWKSLNIDEKQVESIIKKTYYADIASFNPRAAKCPITCTSMMIIRYFYLKKMEKELELSMIYLSFSGKFYPSIHYSSFPTVQPSEYRHIMEYVVNNMLTNKFDLKTHGSILGAVKSICLTWLNSYDKLLKSSEDDDVVYLIQQLHNRIKSFMKNIASLYYDAYKNKENYMTFDSDNLDEDNYHLADNDSLKAERTVEKTMEKINNINIDYKLCKMCSDSNIKTDEIKNIIETIVTDKDSSNEVRELIRLLTVTYYEQSEKKDVRDIDFITFSIAAKPNTKDKNILRIKEIIEGWLDESSPSYRKRKSRLATKNSYNRAVLLYFTLLIHNANK